MFVMLFSKVNNRDGKSIRLASMAANKVMDVSKPRAKVPPKLERQKMPKPKSKMIEV